MKRIVILTGASGSGISSARYVFEELGYYIVEGVPIDSVRSVIDTFANNDFKTTKFCLMVAIQNARETMNIAKQY